MSDTESAGKYTDEDVQDQTHNNRPQGEYTDVDADTDGNTNAETVSETHSTDGTHSHSESQHTVNGHVVEHNSSSDNLGDDGPTHDLAGDGVGEGELDVEDRTERHS